MKFAEVAMTEIKSILSAQKEFFETGRTKNIAFRARQLEILQHAIAAYEERILKALNEDLSKSAYEGYLTEVGIILDEIRFIKRHLSSWAKPRRVRTPYYHFPASSYVYPQPYGVALIISPWNYPFQLTVSPLIGSIAAGNCSVVKPSEFAPHTAQVIGDMMQAHFEEKFIAVIQGDAETAKALLAERFDYIFFTGGTSIGRVVMAAAAEHLTPLALELGGKSPCILDREVELDVAAKRIVSGKFINAGQTCIAPDYLLVPSAKKNELVDRMKMCLRKFYGDDPRQSPDYPRIITAKHFQRLSGFLQNGNILVGGQADPNDLYMAPTLIDGITWEDPVMQEEIFGPILPIMEYSDLQEAISKVKTLPKPLALYFFSNNRQHHEKIIAEIPFGGGCINDTLLHVANPHLPFGGLGTSGIGNYHGKASFDTFSHKKSILRKSFHLDLPLRYPPYRKKLGLLKKIFR
jgi:aldehyde dehydrogenase (NAD+)